MRKLRNSLASDAADALHRTMKLPIFTYCCALSLGLLDSMLKRIREIKNRGKIVITSKIGKKIELRIPSASSLIKKRTYTIVFDCLSNNI